MGFQEVEDNANRQYSAYREINSDNTAAFYPELHTGPVEGVFSNTIGSHLLADILTSHHVVVDLYNYRDESELIRNYGVNKAFLLRLRDAGHVTICSNLLPKDLQDSHWLHDVLSDPRTIFRSVRTPLYFERQLPDLRARQAALKKDLLAILPKTEADIDRLRRLTNAARPPESREAVAEILALWATRLRAAAGYEAEETISQLQTDPESMILQLRREDLCAVAPDSAGLGGTVRLKYENLATYLPDGQPIEQASVVGEAYMRLEALNEFLTRSILNAPQSDLTSEEYWYGLDDYRRDRLFADLDDRQIRLDAARAEETLRLDLSNSDPGTWSEYEVERRAHELARQGERYAHYARLAEAAGTILPAGYFIHPNFEHVVGIPYVGPVCALALLAISHGFLSTEMRRGWLRPLAKRFSSKVHLAHFVQRYGG
jgi:hypothetical protein